MDKSILVTGATGTLGRAVVERLRGAGRAARLLSRRPRRAGDAGTAEWVTGDLKTGAGLDAAVAGIDVILHCADDTRSRTDAGMAVTPRLLPAAVRAGTPHLVYISIVGVDRVPLGYYRAKLADERLIRESGLPHTIQRVTQFHDLVRVILAGSAKLPVMFVPRLRFQSVDVRDVAARLVELADAAPAGRAADLGGPQVLPARDLALTYLSATGRRRPVLAVPLPGTVFRAYREGANLAPDNAVDGITFEQYLAGYPNATSISYQAKQQ